MKSFLGWINLEKYSEIDSTFSANRPDKPTLYKENKNGLVIFESNDNRFLYEDDNYWFLITGEPTWTDPELEQLSLQEDDAVVLRECYKKYGDNVADHVNGHFSATIIHKSELKCLLFTDHIGTRSISYLKTETSLIFSDSLDLIADLPFVKLTINAQSIFNYLYFHIIPSPDTIYSECQKIPPASLINMNGDEFSTAKYWKPEYNCNNYDYETSKKKLFDSLRNAIVKNSTMESTATFLSGGLDSSTVTGLFSKNMENSPTAVSMGFSEEGYDELEFARISAAHFKTTLKEYTVTPADVMSAIPVIVKSFDEPFGNSSAAPTYICAKFAKENGFDSLLAGDGGDEIFAGNERYAKQKLFELYFKVPKIIRKIILEPVFLKLFKKTKFLPIHKIRRYIEQANIPLPDRLLSHNFFNVTPVEEILTSSFLADIKTSNPLEQMKKTYAETTADNFLDKLLELDWKYTLADNDLKKVGNMCDTAKIKVHYPMLDNEVINMACNIPPDEKLHGFKLRYFYKRAMVGFLSEKTLSKPKQGFGLPFGIWLKSDKQLKQLANDSLAGFQKRNIIKPQYLKKLQEQHENTHASFYGEFIWIIIILEQWLQERGR